MTPSGTDQSRVTKNTNNRAVVDAGAGPCIVLMTNTPDVHTQDDID